MGFARSLRARLFVADLPVALARFNLRSLLMFTFSTIFEWGIFLKGLKTCMDIQKRKSIILFFLFLCYPITHVLMYTWVC